MESHGGRAWRAIDWQAAASDYQLIADRQPLDFRVWKAPRIIGLIIPLVWKLDPLLYDGDNTVSNGNT